MMRLPSDGMSIEPPELVRLAMGSSGASTPTELARALRMTSFTAPRNIKRWLDGVAQPDYDATLLLLDAAGLLAADPRVPRPNRRAEPNLSEIAAEIRGLDRKLDIDVGQRLDRLESEVRALARLRVGEST